MSCAGFRHQSPMSATSRVVVFYAVVMLALACLADVAHASGAAGGCPQGKLEAKQSPSSFVDAAVVAVRYELREPAVLARVVMAERSIAAQPVFARRSAPRAPPIA